MNLMKKEKILFIVPPCIALSELMPDDRKMFSSKIRKEIPLGALSLATYLEHYAGAEVSILDLNLKFYDLVQDAKIDAEHTPEAYIYDFLYQLKHREFDFCGISAIFSPTYSYLNIISNMVKEIFPAITVAAGGGVPSNLPEEVFESCPCIDFISYGEGELALLGFLKAEDRQTYLNQSPSLITREKLSQGFDPSFEFIENLDDIPPLDLSLIEFEKYSSHAHSQKVENVIAMPLMFSRGCPFDCCFCASHSIHGKRVRYNSLERIKSDIRLFAEKYQMNTITVWDDNFFVDKKQAMDLLDYFMELNLEVEFVNGFPVYRMDDDMAQRLKNAGIDVVTLAIESGNPRVLKDIIHKPLKLEMVPKAIECLNRHDIYVKGMFVIGFPGESLDDIQVTMDFIHQQNLNWIDIFIASPLPGSELYDVCKSGGYLKNNNMDQCNFWEGNIETEYFKPDQIEAIQIYNTIKKDFVHNLDMMHQNWKRALINFEYVIHAKHENPFAYYYASKAAKELNKMEKAREYYESYQQIRSHSSEWESLFQRFITEKETFPPVIE